MDSCIDSLWRKNDSTLVYVARLGPLRSKIGVFRRLWSARGVKGANNLGYALYYLSASCSGWVVGDVQLRGVSLRRSDGREIAFLKAPDPRIFPLDISMRETSRQDACRLAQTFNK